MFDVPDEIGDNTQAWMFKDFIEQLVEGSMAGMVLMATNDQYDALCKTEFFKRWDRKPFPQLDDDELKKIVEKRLEKARVKDSPIIANPFTDKALDYVILMTDKNPRHMILDLKTVLDAMREDGRKECADTDYVASVLKDMRAYLTADEVLDALISKLLSADVERISTTAVTKMMKDRGVKIDARNVGKMMSDRHFKKIRYPYRTDWQIKSL